MTKSMLVVIATSLFSAGVSACTPAGSNANSDTSTVQAPSAAPAAVVTSVDSGAVTVTPASMMVPAPLAATKTKPKVPAAAKDVAAPKTALVASVQADPAKAASARADSIKQAQARAEAMRVATLDSLKRAEAAKIVAKPETTARPQTVATTSGQEVDGKAPYEENCRKCHGVRGIPPKAIKEKFPKIATFDADFFTRHSADSIVTVLTKGKNEDMKSFKDKLTHDEMVAVAAYIRTFVH